MVDMSARSRRNSLRYAGYDYEQAGWFFVTTCTQDRRSLFGTIDGGLMVPNDIGAMVTEVWEGLPNALPGIRLDRFQIMPDHVHGILFLGAYPSVPAEHSLGNHRPIFQGTIDNTILRPGASRRVAPNRWTVVAARIS